MSEFAKRLNIALANSRRTQRKLATLLDVSPSTVNLEWHSSFMRARVWQTRINTRQHVI